jgi:hypothetical protein
MLRKHRDAGMMLHKHYHAHGAPAAMRCVYIRYFRAKLYYNSHDVKVVLQLI